MNGYDPQSGKWLSEDPIGFAAGDANLSRYVGNGATNYTDPSGLAWGDQFFTEDLPGGGKAVYYVDGGLVWNAPPEYVGMLDGIYVDRFGVTVPVSTVTNAAPSDWNAWFKQNAVIAQAPTYANLTCTWSGQSMVSAAAEAEVMVTPLANTVVYHYATAGLSITASVRAGNSGNFVARGNATLRQTEAGLQAGKALLPQGVIDDLAGALGRARQAVPPGTPYYGARLHGQLAAEIRALQRADLRAEVSYLNGKADRYGKACTSRVDILYGTEASPQFIIDLKTGGATLTERRIREIRSTLPRASRDIPIIELRVD